MRRAEQVKGPPYETGPIRTLCDTLESVLWTRLYAEEPDWSDYHFLDGGAAAMVERTAAQLLVQGGIWVDACQLEPFEAIMRFTAPRRVTLRFANIAPAESMAESWALRSRKPSLRGLSVPRPQQPESVWELQFPGTAWRFSFELVDADL